ncbi:MAG: DUF2723 domain-containing protein [Vicinamibacterales bacterium]
MRPRRMDAFAALTTGAIAMALYVATLQPDFGGPEDTPKFQFLGHLLGTAHPPGYPLYVMLSHVFVQLPIRTVAYRANLFSALMAAVACALAYVIARQIGARRWYAACAAIGLATGASFWRSAVFAEVYSLAAALVAAMMALVLAWGARGGAARLLGGAAVFAAGLGNHLTILGLVPATTVYVVYRDRRTISVRMGAAVLLICGLGLAQYSFIIQRTRHSAAYLESRAESIGELVGVIRADRFADQRFAFGASQVVGINIPAVSSLIGSELGVVGLLLFGVGTAFALIRRSGTVLLLLGGAAGMFAMIVNMSGDLKGFITPVVVLLWPLTALGAEAVHASTIAARVPALLAALLAGLVAVGMPLVGALDNYSEADQSTQTETARFFRGMYRHLPDRAGVVVEDYFYDMAHEYFTAPGEVAAGRHLLRVGYAADEVRAAAASGRSVFAYAGGAAVLAADGLWFQRTSLMTTPLAQWLNDLPRGTLLVGATAYVPVPFEPAQVGHPDARRFGRARSFETFALIVGRKGAAWRADQEASSLVADTGTLGASLPGLPGLVEIRSDAGGARVLIDRRPAATVESGMVLAVFSPSGALARALEFREGSSLDVPFQEALYELRGESACVDLTADGWADVSAALQTGGVVAMLPQMGTAVVEISLPTETRATASLLLGEGVTTVDRRVEPYGHTVFAWTVNRTGERRPLFRLALDAPVPAARARLRPGGAVQSVKMCAHQPSRRLFASDGNDGRLRADFESEALFGSGWAGAERTPTGVVRRGTSAATLLLPLDNGGSHLLVMDLEAPGTFTLPVTVNGSKVGSCEVSGVSRCELRLPAHVVRPGVNAVGVGSESDAPARAFTFVGGRLTRLADAP